MNKSQKMIEEAKKLIESGNALLQQAEEMVKAERVSDNPLLWKPEYGDGYHCLDSELNILDPIWAGCKSNNADWLAGNCFRTEEEAEQARDRRLAEMRYKRLVAEQCAKYDWKADWNDHDQIKHFLRRRFSGISATTIVSSEVVCRGSENEAYFPREASDHILKHGATDWKIWKGIE